jgi:hypothetical protein
MNQRQATALYYARKKRRALVDAAPPSPLGRIKFGSAALFLGNVALLSGTEDDVQLSEALAALSGAVVIGGDSVTISGAAVVAGATELQGSVKAANLATADGAAGVLWKDGAAASVVKVSL